MPDLSSRLGESPFLRVLLVYAAACWPVLEFTAFVRDEFQLPRWIVPGMILLLVAGAVVLVATAWVQSSPLTKARAGAEEVPDAWEVDLGDAGESVARGRLPHLTWARAVLGGVLAIGLLFGLAWLSGGLRDREPGLGASEAVAGEAAPGLAVLPFSTTGPGTEDLREGMVDLLSTNLDGVTGLRTIDSRTVLSRWGESVGEVPNPDLTEALDVARRTGARYALLGKAVGVGGQVRLIADVYDVRSRTRLGQGQVEGSPDELLALVDRLSVEVLRDVLSGEAAAGADALPAVELARVTTSSLPALKAYLQGEALMRHSRFGEATQRYQAAVDADSTFALAWYRLGTSRGWLEGLDDSNVEDFARAARLGERLPERERQLVRAALALARNDPAAIDLAEEIVNDHPDDAEAWYLLGDAQFHLGFQRLLPRGASADAFERTLQLDPNFAPAYIHLIQITMTYEQDSAATADLLRRYHEVAGGSEYDVAACAALQLLWGDPDSAAVRTVADTVNPAALQPLASFLQAPAGLRAQGILVTEIQELPHPGAQVGGTIGRAWNALSRGRARELVGVLEDSRLPPEVEQDLLVQAALMDLPLPESTFQAVLALDAIDSTSAEDLLEAGAYAAMRGREGQRAEARAMLERLAGRLAAAGDTLAAGTAAAMGRTLDAVALFHADRFTEGAELLEDIRGDLHGSQERFGLAVALTYLLGETHLRAGNAAAALRYLLAFPFPTPNIYLYLGQAYEAQGQFSAARESYEQFVLGWRDADPELQPRVDEARAAIRRLTSAIRE